jgi:recombination protein RecA
MAKGVKKEVVESGKGKLADAMDRMNKAYGTGSVLTMDSKSDEEYEIISSGSIGFDYITLGVGGFVKGKMYELMGWEGTGKSTICGHAAANCQKGGGVVLYVDGEHALDTKYFRQLGVNTDAMILSQPSCGEEGFNIAMELIETGEIDLVIIDSDSSLIPKKMLDGDVGDSSIGRKALLNSNAYPKLKGAISKHKVCVIVVSQYREKIGVMFGNPTTTQGGHALKFYSDVRVEVSKSLAKEGDQVYGAITKVKATKNKMSPPYLLSDFEIVYGLGIDTVKEIIAMLVDLEVIRKYGKVVTIHETGEKIDLDMFTEKLMEPVFYEEMKLLIINKIKENEVC